MEGVNEVQCSGICFDPEMNFIVEIVYIQRQIDAQSEQIKALQNVVIEIKNQSLLHTEKEDGNS